jgi:hypothetical protein
MINKKTYKYENTLRVSSLRTVNILPGDRNGLPDDFSFKFFGGLF